MGRIEAHEGRGGPVHLITEFDRKVKDASQRLRVITKHPGPRFNNPGPFYALGASELSGKHTLGIPLPSAFRTHKPDSRGSGFLYQASELVARLGITTAIVYERRAFTRKLRGRPGNHRGTIGLGHRP